MSDAADVRIVFAGRLYAAAREGRVAADVRRARHSPRLTGRGKAQNLDSCHATE